MNRRNVTLDTFQPQIQVVDRFWPYTGIFKTTNSIYRYPRKCPPSVGEFWKKTKRIFKLKKQLFQYEPMQLSICYQMADHNEVSAGYYIFKIPLSAEKKSVFVWTVDMRLLFDFECPHVRVIKKDCWFNFGVLLGDLL